MQQSNYTSDEQKRLLAYEMGVAKQQAEAKTERNINEMTPEERARFDAWQGIAAGSWRPNRESDQEPAEKSVQTEPDDQAVESAAERPSEPAAQADQSATEQSVEQVQSSTNDEAAIEPLSVDDERRIALIKQGAERQSTFIRNATLEHLRANYGGQVQSLDMTDGEQAAYDQMAYQMGRGNNVSNVSAVNAITGVNRADGHDTNFDQVITANGVGALMQYAKQPPAEGRLGLDISEMAIANGAGNTVETKLASQVESVQPLDRLGSDQPDLPTDNTTIDQAQSTVQLIANQQNYGMNSDGTVSNLNERRLEEASQELSDIDQLSDQA